MSLPKNTLAGKRLLVLDGTRIACEIVEHAQALGVHVIVADYNTPDDAPAKRLADEHVLVSIADVDAVVEVIRREHIDGVVAGFSDRMLPYYAEICARAGLPAYGSVDLFRLFTNKSQYKALCRAHGVPTVEEYELSAILSGADESVRYPVVVKPVEGSGSRGIRICANAEEVRSAVLEVSLNGDESGVLVEQCLAGPEATAFWIFQDGEYYLSMLADRHVERYSAERPPLPFAYTAPSVLVDEYLGTIAPAVIEMLTAVGVQNGMMFMQGLIDDGVFRVYDIGYRLTGTQEYRLLDEIGGFNPLNMLINFALTGEMGEPELAHKVRKSRESIGFNVSVSMSPGEVAHVDSIEEVRAIPEVISVVQSRFVGDYLPPEAAGQLRQITVRVLGVASSQPQMLELIDVIGDMVRVQGTDGSDLTLKRPSIHTRSGIKP